MAPPQWTGVQALPEMGQALFERFAATLRERTGMSLPAERKTFLVTSVGLRMREVGFRQYDDYLAFLDSGRPGELEWATLVDRLTVHETRFFRDPASLELLGEHCLPRMLERVRDGLPVHVWSAGCATGEEAYSLAMVLEREFRRRGMRNCFGVVGSDISLPALAVARQGVYPARRVATLPPKQRETAMEALSDGRFRVVDRLRRRVAFSRINLLHSEAAPLTPVDVVYCQNVLIYFDREQRHRILDALAARLLPGGTLILGAGEVFGWAHPQMRRVGGTGSAVFTRAAADTVNGECRA